MSAVLPIEGLTTSQQELVERHVPLVYFCAARYHHIPEDAKEALISRLYWRLCRALQSFDPNRGVKPSSFLVKSLEGEIKRFFRDEVWIVRPPRSLREHALDDPDQDEELAEQIRSCVSPISLDGLHSGPNGEFQLEIPDPEELLEDRVVNQIGGNAIVELIFKTLRPEERFMLSCQMQEVGLEPVQKHFRLPGEVVRQAWKELQAKLELLYRLALEDEPLPESDGNHTLTRALIVHVEATESFVELRRRAREQLHVGES